MNDDPKFQPELSDLERFESLNAALTAMLELSLGKGDQVSVERLRAHIAWNQDRIQRLRRPAASA